jgi:hypothetical protein
MGESWTDKAANIWIATESEHQVQTAWTVQDGDRKDHRSAILNDEFEVGCGWEGDHIAMIQNIFIFFDQSCEYFKSIILCRVNDNEGQ